VKESLRDNLNRLRLQQLTFHQKAHGI